MSSDFENPLPFQPFAGAGVYRSGDAVAREHSRRLHDERLLERLERLGIDGRASGRSTVTAVDLATEGAIAGATRPEVRRWGIFQQNRHRQRIDAQARIRSWLSSQHPDDRKDRRVIQLMLRLKHGNPAPVAELALRHFSFTRILNDALRYSRRRHGSSVVPLSYGIHHRALQGGAFIDIHAHISVDVGRGADLDWLHTYLSRHFQAFISPCQFNLDDGHEEAEAAYELEMFNAHRFSDEHLRTYVSQHHIEHRLHRHQVLGPLREHVSELQRSGLRPILVERGDGKAAEKIALKYRPTIPRLTRQASAPQWQAGPCLLTARLTWVGNQLRPALIIRNWNGDWASLTQRYDVEALVAAARSALGSQPTLPPILATTVNQEQSKNIIAGQNPCGQKEPPAAPRKDMVQGDAAPTEALPSPSEETSGGPETLQARMITHQAPAVRTFGQRRSTFRPELCGSCAPRLH
ncbi:hypothetical protein [Pseudoroseomonas ludipueritiae]|uniref:Uncharacterized protein n=1 Tax=Pseudoroseomonas ludipueritiae TaxID=198093 RepID=A0ABR7R607_9PROT|nr:hypothetical protein [Pseudoroseomonas ludipueritiae]MBC9177161.1 hypothetical protein [Pseudoroseomonas ludipueritiae]